MKSRQDTFWICLKTRLEFRQGLDTHNLHRAIVFFEVCETRFCIRTNDAQDIVWKFHSNSIKKYRFTSISMRYFSLIPERLSLFRFAFENILCESFPDGLGFQGTPEATRSALSHVRECTVRLSLVVLGAPLVKQSTLGTHTVPTYDCILGSI